VLGLLAKGPMTRNEFNRHLSPAHKEALGTALGMLEARGLVRRTKVGHEGAGRPAERWELADAS
jgi:predicted ArsR family transcriptional regulator